MTTVTVAFEKSAQHAADTVIQEAYPLTHDHAADVSIDFARLGFRLTLSATRATAPVRNAVGNAALHEHFREQPDTQHTALVTAARSVARSLAMKSHPSALPQGEPANQALHFWFCRLPWGDARVLLSHFARDGMSHSALFARGHGPGSIDQIPVTRQRMPSGRSRRPTGCQQSAR
jgi:hypothetical protein